MTLRVLISSMAALLALFLALLFAMGPARAQPADPAPGAPLAAAETKYTGVSLYADASGFAPGETRMIAIQMDVAPGWHVFWKNPGDAGLPLAVDWTLPDGFAAGSIGFPAPDYIPVGPLASFAHEGAPVFLIPVTAPGDAEPGSAADISLLASWQTCEEICVPEAAELSFTLPVSAPGSISPQNAPLFERAREAQPVAYQGGAVFERSGDGFSLVLPDWEGPQPSSLFFFPASEGLITPSGEQTFTPEEGALTIALEKGWTPVPDAPSLEGVLKITAAGESTALSITAENEAAGQPLSEAPVGQGVTVERRLPVLLALSFLGGLILNIMPCVFPILFVKASSLMESAHHDAHIVRFHGLLYGAGVLASFLAIGLVLIILRAGGEQLGWGFHLQSPLVTGLSAYLLFAVGLNLAGVFSIGESVTGFGDQLAQKRGGGGAFFTGVLAVVVAAPCIGPLLTAPMGAVLIAPAPVALSIFLAMAVGLAAPFVALTFVPRLGRILPRPGNWMVILKQALAFPVFAAAVYFVWVLARQAGDGALAGALVGLVLIGLGAWLFELSKGANRRAVAVRALSAVALLAALAPLVRAEPVARAPQASAAYGEIATIAYDPQTLADLRAAQTPVFLDFTAAWCITCQVNKMTVLTSSEVALAFERAGVRMMVADWTVRDPQITQALADFGAAGVPLYVYYPPGGAPVILPQSLSKSIVMEAIVRG